MESLSISTSRLWTGRILSGIVIAFMLFDGIIHVAAIPAVVEASNQMGFPVASIQILGAVELLCVLLYMIPRTSIIGAILLTGYLGGAMSIQVKLSAPLFSTLLFPIYIGALLWGGLYLIGRLRLHQLIAASAQPAK
jgi:hypothetical protein